MTNVVLRGVTWRHRRAVDPLVNTVPAFRRQRPDIDVRWDARSLHDFAFQPIAELAERYDLIVYDHPFAGAIARERSLLPLDDLITPELAAGCVGPSLETYRYDGKLWGLPLDAATQVAVYRSDLLEGVGGDVPRTWDEMFALGERAARQGLRLATAFQGVHTLMTFFTLCANQGRPCATDRSAPFIDPAAARAALAAMRRLLELCPPEVLDWDTIDVQDAMSERDDLLYCPCVYGFAPYGEPDRERPLRYADLPGLKEPSCAGSTVGGAGIGVSAKTRHREAAFAYVDFLMAADTQGELFPAHHGQPGRFEAWRDGAVNARFGGFFADTLRTMQEAWIRPRYDGYMAFQEAAGALVERHLRGEIGEAELLSTLDLWHSSGVDGG